ncbi:unnamed protein product [Clonostachys rosea f. rosea IK726]|uniref:Uncharacterized protein n=2 Tax=Bionectria ochroleuca TaxID=29856 RepID=A0A0B7K5S0_BIOOC|nr:unnamed protein product [Clonostachys rosea f. rosea IK726]
MKFSAVLAWASLALAAPTPAAVEERDVIVISTFVSTVQKLETTVKTQVDDIVSTAKITSNVDEIVSSVKGNLATIITAVTESTGTIAQIAAASPADAIKGLKKADVKEVLVAVKSVNNIVSELKIAVSTIVKDVPSAVKTALADEINQVKGLLWPFLQPVLTIVGAVENLASSLGIKTDQLVSALSLVLGLVNGILNLVNLPQVL